MQRNSIWSLCCIDSNLEFVSKIPLPKCKQKLHFLFCFLVSYFTIMKARTSQTLAPEPHRQHQWQQSGNPPLDRTADPRRGSSSNKIMKRPPYFHPLVINTIFSLGWSLELIRPLAQTQFPVAASVELLSWEQGAAGDPFGQLFSYFEEALFACVSLR